MAVASSVIQPDAVQRCHQRHAGEKERQTAHEIPHGPLVLRELASAPHAHPTTRSGKRFGGACDPLRDVHRARRVTRPAEQLEDERLVARAQAGDRAAFEQLVRRHADRLHAVVRRICADDLVAQEVTQETFLRAWRALPSFKGDAQFFTWLYRIGVNEANRHLGRRPPAGTVGSLEEQLTEPADPGPGPGRAAEGGELRAALENAVRGLEPTYRAPLVLRDIEGLSTAQAAEILGIGEAALKSRLHRARMAVREAVADYVPDSATDGG